MRRISLILIAVLTGLVLASPASAQGRDPFEPQPGNNQEENGGNGSGSGERDPFDPSDGAGSEQPSGEDPSDPSGEDPTDPSEDPAPQQPAPDDDEVGGTLSNTGFDVTTWGAVAYLLIALGAAALVFGKRFAPTIARRRRK